MPLLVDEMDEFEPLFDYSRVQPNIVCLDDDDEDVVCVTKKRKNSHHVVENKKTNANPVAVADLEDKDDDWLPSPPKVKNNLPRKNIEEDSTLKDLRLKKQELASFAESAKDLLKTIEESAENEISNSLQSSIDVASENTTKPSERAKILISVQDKDETKQIRMFMDDKFERIVKQYAEKKRCDVKQIILSFDGDKISSSATPASLGMEDDDIIEVNVK